MSASNRFVKQTSSLANLLVILIFCDRPTTGALNELIRYRTTEEIARGTIVGHLANDVGLTKKYKPEVLALLDFSILSQPAVPVVIDRKTGIISTDGKIDRDSLVGCRDRRVCEVTLDVAVKPAQFFQIVKVTLEIEDINDHSPQFRGPRQVVIPIRESAAVGNSFPLPVASDADSLDYGVRRYTLVPVEPDADEFRLNVGARRDGTLEPRLIIQKSLDREKKERHQLKLIAFDGGTPPKSAVVDLTVDVLDSNDHVPVFDSPVYEVNVTENAPFGTKILRVRATDNDTGVNGEITYGFSNQTMTAYGHLFSIHNQTGEISIKGNIDYETHAVHQLSVIAQDRGPDSLPVDAAVVVRVVDRNDNAPTIVVNTLTARRTDTADVLENQAIGTFVAHVNVHDVDGSSNGR